MSTALPESIVSTLPAIRYRSVFGKVTTKSKEVLGAAPVAATSGDAQLPTRQVPFTLTAAPKVEAMPTKNNQNRGKRVRLAVREVCPCIHCL
jgi:hypothetical protein